MSKKIKHIWAKPWEHIKVHRPGGGNNGGDGWGLIIYGVLILIGVGIAVKLIKAIVAAFLAALPYILGFCAIVFVGYLAVRRHQIWAFVQRVSKPAAKPLQPSQTAPTPASVPVTAARKPKIPQTRGSTHPVVYDLNRAPKQLDSKVGKGGEGEVWSLMGQPDSFVKLYHRRILDLQGHGDGLQEKIAFMQSQAELKKDKRLAWPRMQVFDASQQWAGYGMRRVSGFGLQTLCVPQLMKERLPHWNRRNLVIASLSFIALLDYLHRRNILVGDINPGNFLVDGKTSSVGAIDCDSYQVTDGSRIFRCGVGIPMYLAPELLDVNLCNVTRTEQHELFSVAIILFKILMVGGHPYSRVLGEDPVTNLRSGMCPLGKGSECRFPHGPWYNIWSHLPYGVKNLFISAFRKDEGHSNPAKRPKLNEWRDAMEKYLAEMDKGYHSTEVVPAKPDSSEYKN